jgi:hypothetical protein
MKKMKDSINKIFLALLSLLFLVNSCDLDQLEDPNNLTAEDVDITLLLSNVQHSYQNVTAGDKAGNEPGLNTASMQVIRMKAQFGAYTGAFTDLTATSMDQVWKYAYVEVLKNAQTVIELAGDEDGLAYHAGIAKTMSAMTLVNLVDHFNDIPWREALQGASNTNPTATSGEDVYSDALDLLNSAIADFSKDEPATLPTDYYYDNDPAKWINFINTFKIKMFLQKRLIEPEASADSINAIINSGNYITTEDGDMEYTYTSVSANPDSRHPDFANNYSSSGADDYMSNWYMNSMGYEKSVTDPRMRYYFYRQVEEAPSDDMLPCESKTDYSGYCYIGGYYWGRDHGDDDGVPSDGDSRTTFGVYPVGGAFDADDFEAASENTGLGGAGIFPIMLSSYVNFMLAESALELGTTGDARTYFENGIRQSIEKVMDFGASIADTSYVPKTADVESYVSEALARYDDPTNDDYKYTSELDVVIKEYFLALFGNGMEAYNAYRRTGFPSDIQEGVVTVGSFPRTFQYPADLVNLNSNFSQRSVTEPVFWDDESANLK